MAELHVRNDIDVLMFINAKPFWWLISRYSLSGCWSSISSQAKILLEWLFLPLGQEIETSSRCLQLCSPQPLCSQSARLYSDPEQWMSSIQIIPSPGPYSWPNDRPEDLFNRQHFIANRTCNTTITMVTVFATSKYDMTQ